MRGFIIRPPTICKSWSFNHSSSSTNSILQAQVCSYIYHVIVLTNSTGYHMCWWACSFGTAIYSLIFAFYYFPSIVDTPAMQHTTVTSCVTLTSLCNRSHHIAPSSLTPLPIAPSDRLHVLNVHVIYGPRCYISLSWWVPTLFSDIPSFTLLIWHHDTQQLCLVTWLALTWLKPLHHVVIIFVFNHL